MKVMILNQTDWKDAGKWCGWLAAFYIISFIAEGLTGLSVPWQIVVLLSVLMFWIRNIRPDGMIASIGLILVAEALLSNYKLAHLSHLMMGVAIILGTIASIIKSE